MILVTVLQVLIELEKRFGIMGVVRMVVLGLVQRVVLGFVERFGTSYGW